MCYWFSCIFIECSLNYLTASRIPPDRFIWNVVVIEIWLIGLVFLFGLIGAPFFLVVGVLCGSPRCFLTPRLKLVVMRHGETIAMLLKDRAGGRRVSHISEPSREWCFGTTCGPFGSFLTFCFQNCQSYGPWMPQCLFRVSRVPFLRFWLLSGLHFGSQNTSKNRLKFWMRF